MRTPVLPSFGNFGGETFFVKTNLEAPKHRLVAIDLAHPEPGAWKTLIPEGDDPLDGITILNHEFVVTTMQDVASAVTLYRLDGTKRGTIDLPGVGRLETWQFTFAIVALPGALIAALLMTLPNPVRHSPGTTAPAAASWPELWRYVYRYRRISISVRGSSSSSRCNQQDSSARH